MILKYINGDAWKQVKMFQNPAGPLPEEMSEDKIIEQLREGIITPEQAKQMRPGDAEFASRVDSVEGPTQRNVDGSVQREQDAAAIQQLGQQYDTKVDMDQFDRGNKWVNAGKAILSSKTLMDQLEAKKKKTAQNQQVEQLNTNPSATSNTTSNQAATSMDSSMGGMGDLGGKALGALGTEGAEGAEGAAPGLGAKMGGAGAIMGIAGDTAGTAEAIDQGDTGEAINKGSQAVGSGVGMALGGPAGAMLGKIAGSVVGGIGKALAGPSRSEKKAKKSAEIYNQNVGMAKSLQGQLNYGSRAMKGSKIVKKVGRVPMKKKAKKHRQGGKVTRPSLIPTDYYGKLAFSRVPMARNGMKIAGLYEPTGGRNIIPRGVLHEEWNELGDKGIPILAKGDKVAEIERDEIIFHLDASEMIEKLSKEYAKTGNSLIAAKLGEIVRDEILHNTEDKTGKFI